MSHTKCYSSRSRCLTGTSTFMSFPLVGHNPPNGPSGLGQVILFANRCFESLVSAGQGRGLGDFLRELCHGMYGLCSLSSLLDKVRRIEIREIWNRLKMMRRETDRIGRYTGF